jgi:hypothetical protein
MTSNVAPDLVLHYSLLQSSSTKETKDSVVCQTSSSPLYAEVELNNVIGDWTFDSTIYNITNPKCISEDKYPGHANAVLFLPQGTIEYCSDLANFKLELTTQQYIYPDEKLFVFPIESGTGNFLNVSGFVVVIPDNVTNTRDILVYFDK